MAILGKISSSFLRTLQVLGTLYCIGVTSYFMVKLSRGSRSPSGHALAVEIISGAGFVYSTFMFMLAICLLQKRFFQFFTFFWDILFCGGFIAIAVLLRSAPGQNCSSGRTTTPNPQWLGNVTGARPSIYCKLIVGIFGASVGLAVLFFLTAIIALLTKPSKKQRYEDTTTHSHRRHKESTARGSFMPFARRKGSAVTDTRPSMDTTVTKDEEKASDLGVAGGAYRGAPTLPAVARARSPVGNTTANPTTTAVGTHPHHHHHHHNSAVGAGSLAPVVPPNRAVSPVSNYDYDNTNTNVNNNTYAGVGAFGGHNSNRMSELGTPDAYGNQTGYTAYNPARNEGAAYEMGDNGHVDPNVGGVTTNVFKTHVGGMRA